MTDRRRAKKSRRCSPMTGMLLKALQLHITTSGRVLRLGCCINCVLVATRKAQTSATSLCFTSCCETIAQRFESCVQANQRGAAWGQMSAFAERKWLHRDRSLNINPFTVIGTKYVCFCFLMIVNAMQILADCDSKYKSA